MFIIKSCNNLAPISFYMCVRLTNLDLDFEIQFSDFAIKHEVQERFSPPRIGLEGGLQLRNPSPNFMDFLLYRSIGNSEKDLQNCSREQWSFFR